MGFWFFLTVVVVGNMALKAYKWQVLSRSQKFSDHRVAALELELKAVREKIQHLDEAVFFDDFELKRKFDRLESDVAERSNQVSIA